jgi:hypothetical protein
MRSGGRLLPLTVGAFITIVDSFSDKLSGQQDHLKRLSCNPNKVSAPHQYWRTTYDVHQKQIQPR